MKVIKYPLNKANRIVLARAYRNVSRVDMSIECVIEDQMGEAFVDNLESPRVFKIQVGPFFYLAGDPNSEGAQVFLENIEPYTLFMPSSPGWIDAAKDMYNDRLISFDRFSFSPEGLSVEHIDNLMKETPMIGGVGRIDIEFAESVWEKDHFVDLSDFDSPGDFVERGVGYYMKADKKTIGAAYSSLVCNEGIEVSLFVVDEYRRRGVATVITSKLLKWCLENNARANWDAANPASCKLAEKLGYKAKGSYQAYYLKEQS